MIGDWMPEPGDKFIVEVESVYRDEGYVRVSLVGGDVAVPLECLRRIDTEPKPAETKWGKIKWTELT